jgi:hypothetical protein
MRTRQKQVNISYVTLGFGEEIMELTMGDPW